MAVLIVFIYHYGGGTHSSFRLLQMFGFVNKGGWAGVTLFFVLSGFLITGILWDSFDQPHWWRDFYIRRMLRIFPLYCASIAFVILASALKGTLRPTLHLIWIPALFLQNMPHLTALVDRIPSPLALFHFWSLAVEEQFYLIWPFLLFFQKFRGGTKAGTRTQNLCLGIFVFACIFRLLIWNVASDPDSFAKFLVTRSGELAAGGWLAIAYRGPQRLRIERIAPVAALLGAAGFVASGIYSGSLQMYGPGLMIVGLPCITIAAAALLVLAMRPGIIQRSAEAHWLRWLGSISYGVYVFHLLFVSVYVSIEQKIFGQRSQLFTNAAVLCVAAIGSVSLAWISFRFVETPFLKLKDRFSARPARAVSELTS